MNSEQPQQPFPTPGQPYSPGQPYPTPGQPYSPPPPSMPYVPQQQPAPSQPYQPTIQSPGYSQPYQPAVQGPPSYAPGYPAQPSYPPQPGYPLPPPGYAPPPQPPRRNTGLIITLSVVGGIVALCLVVGLFAALAIRSGGTSSSAIATTDTGSSSSPAQPTATTKTAVGAGFHRVGEPVKTGIWTVTVNSVRTDPGTQYNTPKAGNTFLVVDVTLVNNGTKTEPVSSLLDFDIKDSTGQRYNETFLSGATSPDADVVAGDKLRGQLPYEVPLNQKTFTFTFKPDFTSTVGIVNWTLTI